jgi:CRISPR-associated protein Cas2
MDILVTYDVNTLTKQGRARLRRVAKLCEGHGQRVQFSVFECTVNDAQMEVFRARLLKAINTSEDSLRLYTLRGGREGCVQSFGNDAYVDFQAPLVV